MISYNGSNEFNEKVENKEEGSNSISCDACDILFAHETAFNKHIAEHKVCGLYGCTFSADEKNIEEHRENQHSNESLEKIKLEAAKWQEERRLKHTLNKANRERIQREQEELERRGIRIGERNNKFGKDKKRFERKDPQALRKEREKMYKKKKTRRDKNIQKLQPKLVIDEKSDWNNGLRPFKGIKNIEVEQEETFNISDDEEDFNKKSTKIEDLVNINSSLGALMAYGSDFSEEDEEMPKNKVTENKDVEKEMCIMKPVEDISQMKENSNEIYSEEEGPMEVKIERTGIVYENDEEKLSVNLNRRRSNVKNKNKMVERNETHKFPYELKPRRISLLEKLLDRDIRRERNMVLQFVRYTVKNNFFLKDAPNND
ncbi:nuclear fragile X mental retardation-interacting protein 1-like [Harmonia axyridis]|uniref:nuclear fragile X mental retardation-interacting protein 1-like n=1 Tax=Harmonia axyridis TaxID=115357 RepID=UPI001E2774DB|nr:nuclear fragile X mental retardation-interacting protein 1-like [Harmonia axyridis]